MMSQAGHTVTMGVAVFALRMQCMHVVTEVTGLCVTMVGAAYQNFATATSSL